MTEFNENLFYRINTAPRNRISIDQFTFPGGEVGVNINTGNEYSAGGVDHVVLAVRAKNSDTLIAAFMATDALRRHYHNAKIHLELAYIPYARQDRVCNAGEALSIKVVAQLINAQNYATVSVVDPHSPTSVALIDRVIVRDQFEVFGRIKQDWHNWTIVAPDAGAMKKVEDFAKRVGAKGIVCFNKTRELSTGKIIGMTCLDELKEDGKYLVLDDICDGGRTFIELAEKFPDYATLELAVTHGIFSKGIKAVETYYNRVYTTNSWNGNLRTGDHQNLTVITI